MIIVMTLLLVNGVLGAIDTLWYHEWKVGLAGRGAQLRVELALHAGRDAVYAVIYATLGWFAWAGGAAALLAGLLAVEIAITLADFIVEDRLRPSVGGMAAGERVLHTLMAIVYGAMLANLLPELLRWGRLETGFAAHHLVAVAPRSGPLPPSWMAVAASLLAVGIALSGVRDALAVAGIGTRLVQRRGPQRQTDRTARAVSPSSSSPARPVSPTASARRPKLTM